MKNNLKIIIVSVGILTFTNVSANQPLVLEGGLTEFSTPLSTTKQMKLEAMLTSKKWVCLDVSKRRLTKKLAFDVGNEFSFSIDKKYNFKNNNYDYSSGKWKLDGKYVYLFYNVKGTENRIETAKYKIIKLNETTLILKRMDKPRGKITFK
jgi:hypothetical protein